MRILRSPICGLGLALLELVAGACKAPDSDPFSHLTEQGGSDSSAAGAEQGGAEQGGAKQGGAGTGGVASGEAGAKPAGGSGGGGGDSGCPAGSPVGANCACAATQQDLENCQALAAGILHRYSFNGTGLIVDDSVSGGSNGTMVNMTLTGSGDANFTSAGQYVDLPNHLVSSLTSVTLEAWATWKSGAPWQRIFDFGDTTIGAEGEQGFGRSYLFLSPRGTGSFVRAVFKSATGVELVVDSSPSLTSGVLTHVSVTFDDTRKLMSLYVAGKLGSTVAVTDSLADINDINNWLGRSQYNIDPAYTGSIQEFRVYGVALTAAQVAFSNAQGPDTALFAHAQ